MASCHTHRGLCTYLKFDIVCNLFNEYHLDWFHQKGDIEIWQLGWGKFSLGHAHSSALQIPVISHHWIKLPIDQR